MVDTGVLYMDKWVVNQPLDLVKIKEEVAQSWRLLEENISMTDEE